MSDDEKAKCVHDWVVDSLRQFGYTPWELLRKVSVKDLSLLVLHHQLTCPTDKYGMIGALIDIYEPYQLPKEDLT